MYEMSSNKDMKIPVRKLSWTQIVNIVYKVNMFCVLLLCDVITSNEDLSCISMPMSSP